MTYALYLYKYGSLAAQAFKQLKYICFAVLNLATALTVLESNEYSYNRSYHIAKSSNRSLVGSYDAI